MNTEEILKKQVLEVYKEKKKKEQKEKKKPINKTIKKTDKSEKEKKFRKKIKILDEPYIEPEKSPSIKKIIPKPPYNEQFASLMGELSQIMAKKGDNIRSRVYKRAEETIMSITTDINSIDDIKGKPGIGTTIIEKFKEYIETGTLELIEREKNKPENVLSDIYGVGPQKAKDLVNKGITTIEHYLVVLLIVL